MRSEDFTINSSGVLIPTVYGAKAFLPQSLPPALGIDPELAGLVERVSLSIGNLRGLSHSLPSPWLLVRPLLRREAIYSSRIEGTITSPEQLALYEANPSVVRDQPTVREVHNYVTALMYGLRRFESLPICLRLIRELHRELMDGVRGGDRRPGEFRNVQNWIGRRGARIEEAGYVPPPPDRMRESLDEFDKYVGFVDESPLPKLINLPLIHYQFEAIHPFADGNGRIGRLLVTLLMAQWGLLPIPFLSLSAYLERHRQDYVGHLLSVSQAGAWDPWLKFFLRGMHEESEDAANRIQQLIELRESYRERLQTARSPANLLRLVDELFEVPVLSVATAARRLGVTWRSARGNVDKLVATDILGEIDSPGRSRLFMARGILDTIESSAFTSETGE